MDPRHLYLFKWVNLRITCVNLYFIQIVLLKGSKKLCVCPQILQQWLLKRYKAMSLIIYIEVTIEILALGLQDKCPGSCSLLIDFFLWCELKYLDFLVLWINILSSICLVRTSMTPKEKNVQKFECYRKKLLHW